MSNARSPRSIRIVLGLALVSVASAALNAQCELQRLTVGDHRDGLQFGRAVAVEGDRWFVGAPGNEHAGIGAGAVYVFEYDGAHWHEVQRLVASDAEPFAGFGMSLAVDGDWLLIGAPGDSIGGVRTGAGYFFQFDGTAWRERQIVNPGDVSQTSSWGLAADLAGSTAVLGGGPDSLPAVVLRFDGVDWQEAEPVLPWDGLGTDTYGYDVTVTPGTLAVGDWSQTVSGTSFAGAVYVFRESGGAFTPEQKIHGADLAPTMLFGFSVDADANHLLVGAPWHEELGAAYLFEFDGSQWNESQKLSAPELETEAFGWSVALHGDGLIIGAPRSSPGDVDSGSAYTYRHETGSWHGGWALVPRERNSGDELGIGVAVDDGLAAVGAPSSDLEGAGAGAVWTFAWPPLLLDADPTNVRAGDTLTFAVTEGLAGRRVLLAVVAIDGTTHEQVLTLGVFDDSGNWSWAPTVPPGLDGHQMDFLALGYHHCGRLLGSDSVTVTFE